jgi:hypothetical protein
VLDDRGSVAGKGNDGTFSLHHLNTPPWRGAQLKHRDNFTFTIASIPVLGPLQPPIQWIPGTFNQGLKRPGRKAGHSPPSRAEVKSAWIYTSILPTRLRGVISS